MDIEAIQDYCLSFPGVTSDIQWEDDLLFRIGGKIFAAINLDPASLHRLSFKCTPAVYTELIEREDIVPAPYVARYHWVALQHTGALSDSELKTRLRDSYEMVFAGLPKKVKLKIAKRRAGTI